MWSFWAAPRPQPRLLCWVWRLFKASMRSTPAHSHSLLSLSIATGYSKVDSCAWTRRLSNKPPAWLLSRSDRSRSTPVVLTSWDTSAAEAPLATAIKGLREKIIASGKPQCTGKEATAVLFTATTNNTFYWMRNNSCNENLSIIPSKNKFEG